MKRGLVVFLRVIFVLLLMIAAVFFGMRSFYTHQSQSGIEKALNVKGAPVIGDKLSPFSVVEFFDYRCPHCPTLSHLVNESLDGDVKTKIILRPAVLRDDDSFKIAALVLALEKQKPGDGAALHKKIMDLSEVPTYETVKAMAQSMGVDVSDIEKRAGNEDIKAEILHNTQLVRDIGFYGVPALVIGDRGFVPRERMPGINELRLMILDAKSRLGVKN